MAKNITTAASPERPAPRASIYWDKDSAKLTGDLSDLSLGAKVTVVITGTVSAYSMQEWGCDFGVKVTALEVKKGDAKPDEDGKGGRSLVSLAAKLGKKGDK